MKVTAANFTSLVAPSLICGKNHIQFGVICSNSIPEKSVFLYAGDGQLCQPFGFEQLMTLGLHWCTDQRYLASLVATSVLKSNSSKTDGTVFESNEAELQKLWKSETEERSRKSAAEAVGFTTSVKRKNTQFKFPTELIFGPEQLEVVNNRINIKIFLITGEASCGKTTTLLTILFKYTAKHVAETSRRKKWNFLFLKKRRLYRSTSGLSKICAKVRRLMDRKLDTDSHMNIPWAMSFYNGTPMKERASIEVWSYQSDQSICDSLKVLPKTNRTLLVLWKIGEEEAENIYKQFPQCTIFHLTMDMFSVNNLTFTGSEFRNVILVFGGKVDCDSEYTTLLLYNSMTRATERAFVLCSGANLQEMKSTLSLSSDIDIIFEKLRSGNNLGYELFSNITDPTDRLEIMKRLVAWKNKDQIKALKDSDFLKAENLSEGEKHLAQCLEMLEHCPTEFQPLIEFFLTEKTISFVENPTFENIRPIMKILEPLRVTFPSEGHQLGRMPLGDRIDQTDLMTHVMAKFHPTDMRSNLKDWLRQLTKEDEYQVANLCSHFDVNKLGKLRTSCLSLISRATKTEILRNVVLFLNKKELQKQIKRYSLNIPELFTEELDDGSTLLHKYAHGSTQSCFEVVLDHLPESKVKFSDGCFLDNCQQNPLITAIGNSASFFVITKRAKVQGDLVRLLTHRDKFGWSCLRWACRVDNLKVVKAMIGNKDKSLDWPADLDPDGRTLIHLVCALGHTHILRYLLTLDEKQPEPFNVTKSTSNSPLAMTCLHLTCLFGRAEIVKMLIEAAPDLVFMDFQGINCLILASRSIFKDKECIVNLLKDKLPGQQLTVTQEDLILFMVSKIRSLNHNNFVDETEMNNIHPKNLKSFKLIFLFLFSLRTENQEKAAISGNAFTFNCYIY